MDKNGEILFEFKLTTVSVAHNGHRFFSIYVPQ